MLILGALILGACQTSGRDIVRDTEEIAEVPPPPALPSVDEIQIALRAVPAREGVSALADRGFFRPSESDLAKIISGNTLKVVNSFSFYVDDTTIKLKEIALGGGLESRGTWTIKERNLCHSVREGHEFCTGVFFRNRTILCWPGIGWTPDDTNYIRHCALLAGDGSSPARGTSVASLDVLFDSSTPKPKPRKQAKAKPRKQAKAKSPPKDNLLTTLDKLFESPAPKAKEQTQAKANSPSIDQVLAALRGVPARDGIGELAKRGFLQPASDQLGHVISGNTLKINYSFSYYGKDKKIKLKENALGGGLESRGTWIVKEKALCHSVREGHEFCSGIFFRGGEILCWPGIGWSPDDIDYLRYCSVLAGDRTAPASGASVASRDVLFDSTAPKAKPRKQAKAKPKKQAKAKPPLIDRVLAALRGVPARDGIGELEKQGFTRPSERDLVKKITGNTLKVVNSFSFYGDDDKIKLKEIALGGGLESRGTWTIKERNLCHSVREGHEFCSGIFFRGGEILCWPGIGWAPDDTDYLRHCSILSGDTAG